MNYMSFSAKSFKKIAEKSNLTKLNSIVCETNSYVKGQTKPTEEYARAVSEVLEIIKYMNKPSVKKLSKKLLDFFEQNRDLSYVEKIDTKRELEENELSSKTKSIITMIYRNYLCTLNERDLIDATLRENNNYIFVQNGEQQLDDETDEMLGMSEVKESECHDEQRRVCSLLDSEEEDEEFEDDKKFNSYINVRDFDLEKQLVELTRVRKKIEKNRR